MSARTRYDYLSSFRSEFLNTAVKCSQLTLPYLIQQDIDTSKGSQANLKTPWQSVGAKGTVTLASKLMLALLPPQTSFFKLQVDELKIPPELPPEVRTDLDVSFAKLERKVMEHIAASSDRVIVNQGVKHLVVGGNVLLFMGKDQLKLYPLNRYVLDRDGNGNTVEIVTKEKVSKKILESLRAIPKDKYIGNQPAGQSSNDEEVDIYTHVQLIDGQYKWYQEVDGIKLDKRFSGSAPRDSSPWLPLRWNTVDGEAYGRGRVEEFLGDLVSLEGLMQAVVEGSALAAKVFYRLDPGSTTKPRTLAKTPNGGIIQGKEGDIEAIQTNKAMDFKTAQMTIADLTQRLNEAFLVLSVRQSERTTAEEVRMTQLELEQQLGGLFSLLTVEFLIPYLNRKLSVMQRTNQLPKIPKGMVKPTIVAGINALGRGQDAESLNRFVGTVAQAFGPEALAQFIDPLEAIKRLAAGMGIETLNLVKTQQQVDQQQAEGLNRQKELSLTDQTAALASTPMMDPTKNPNLTPNDGTTGESSDQTGASEAN